MKKRSRNIALFVLIGLCLAIFGAATTVSKKDFDDLRMAVARLRTRVIKLEDRVEDLEKEEQEETKAARTPEEDHDSFETEKAVKADEEDAEMKQIKTPLKKWQSLVPEKHRWTLKRGLHGLKPSGGGAVKTATEDENALTIYPQTLGKRFKITVKIISKGGGEYIGVVQKPYGRGRVIGRLVKLTPGKHAITIEKEGERKEVKISSNGKTSPPDVEIGGEDGPFYFGIWSPKSCTMYMKDLVIMSSD
ncbi:MAG: hypothetical protein KGZ25_16030 [Planctomycetes bacterium]|nr:hypothetical protein [Planctomycetota bacterium]